MKVLEATTENLTELCGVPYISDGIYYWDIECEGKWIEIQSVNKKPGLFKVYSLLSCFTREIKDEIKFINKYTKTFTSS